MTIPNNSFVDVDEIAGKRPVEEGILCHTDYSGHGHGLLQMNTRAGWYFPNGSRVWHHTTFSSVYGHVPANVFLNDTGYGLIRMYVNGRPSERGLFSCKIPDANGTLQVLYVTLGNSKQVKTARTSVYTTALDSCSKLMTSISMV